MANIKRRGRSWVATLDLGGRGGKPLTKTFRMQADAQLWAKLLEQDFAVRALSPDTNFLHLTTTELGYPVYRIMSLDRLFEMFENRSNYLVKPIKWDDPFENFIASLKGRLPNGEVVEFAQRYDFFGQCWTFTGGTDAMWRIYSGDKQSVRIKVRLLKLYEQLSSTAKGVPCIGRVRYLREDQLTRWAKRVVQRNDRPNVRMLAKTFLVKRTAFAHENEVRLLYCAGPSDSQHLLHRHPFDCHSVIEEIQLDPRLTQEEAALLAAKIKLRTRYDGRIAQSQLYLPPKDFILPLNTSYSSLPKSSARVTYSGDLRTTRVSDLSVPQLVLPTGDVSKVAGSKPGRGASVKMCTTR